MRKVLLLAVLALAVATPAETATRYIVTGPMHGIGSAFLFLSTRTPVHAVDTNGDGRLERLPASFSRVSEYRKGKCWVRVGLIGEAPVLGRLLDKVMGGPVFYRKDENGGYVKVKTPDYIVFPCTPR